MLKFDFRTQVRSHRYYNQYQYCLVFGAAHMAALRSLDLKWLDYYIRIRDDDSAVRIRWMTKVTPSEQRTLHQLLGYLQAHSTPYKKVVSSNTMWIYTNDPQSWQDILQHCPRLQYLGAQQVDVSIPQDVILLKNPKHQYRTYFKDLWVNAERLDQIREFFNARTDIFEPSPSFYEVMIGKRLWIASWHFVNHNDAKLDLVMQLACPGLVSKTMRILPRDK